MTSLTRSLLWMGTWHACGNGRLANYLLQVGAVFDWWFGRDGVNVNLFSPFLCMSSATATCSESFGLCDPAFEEMVRLVILSDEDSVGILISASMSLTPGQMTGVWLRRLISRGYVNARLLTRPV